MGAGSPSTAVAAGASATAAPSPASPAATGKVTAVADGGGSPWSPDAAGKAPPPAKSVTVTTKESPLPVFWTIIQLPDEISLILDQDALALFPPTALTHDPMQWRAIRLLSRPIPFHVTGMCVSVVCLRCTLSRGGDVHSHSHCVFHQALSTACLPPWLHWRFQF